MQNNKLIWENILKLIFSKIKKAHFLTWFKDTMIMDYQNGLLVLGVPTVFAQNYLNQHFNRIVLECAKEVLFDLQDVRYDVRAELNDLDKSKKINLNAFKEDNVPDKKARKVYRKQEVRLVEGITSKLLNPKYTLDNFVVGQETRLAHAACMAVASEPGGAYNPLFIYGGVGLGKTHLLQATGNEILKDDPDRIVVYIPSERFINEIVEAIGKRNTKEFRSRYRTVDCLIVDDVQFFANKEMTQMEFFHTFNELYDANKQIIISSDRPPRELSTLHDRLTSRFSMGMIVDLAMPGYETRLAILQAKCYENQVLVSQEVLDFIASNVKGNIRELEGVLLQAIAQSRLKSVTPTVKLVAEILSKLDKEILMSEAGDYIQTPNSVRSPEEVINVVADYYRIPRSDLIGNARQKEIMISRQVAMYLIRYELNYSYDRIGKDFGGKNHTTVMHACDKIVSQLNTNERIVSDINAIKNLIGL